MEQEGTGEWLLRVLAEEVDLRSPKSSAEKEEEYLKKCAHVTLFGEQRPAAHCELRRCGGALELCTVIVDPEKRGIGLSHELVRLSLERATHDPIVSGQTLGDHSPPLIFSFTRSAALATSLTKGGYRIQPAKRRFCRLFLWRSASANLPIFVQLALAKERLGRTIKMLFKDRRKAKQQVGNVGEYHLFTRIAGSLPEREEPMTTDGIVALGMNVARVTDEDLVDEGDSDHQKSLISDQKTHAWDEGE
jgi:hypothetical protein